SILIVHRYPFLIIEIGQHQWRMCDLHEVYILTKKKILFGTPFLLTALLFLGGSILLTALLFLGGDESDDKTSITEDVETIINPMEDWPKFRRDLANTGRSIETGISSTNAHRLKLKWKFDTDSKIIASPAVATIDGIRTVYIGNSAGIFYAVDADTGDRRWSFTIDRGRFTCSNPDRCRIGSSAAVENGIVYFGAENAYLYALDAADGTLLWKKQLGDPDTGYEIWSSPAVYNGIVYVGVASHMSMPCVAGRVVALDSTSGANVWSFNTIDQATCPSGFCLGAGVWSSPAIDTHFGTLYIGTGNSGKGCVPSTANATKYPDGILGVDLTNGQLKSFFQTFPNDLNDKGDVGATPALYETKLINECEGTNQTSFWITVPTKDSFLYTAQRGISGLLSDPVGIPLDSGRAIASPAVLPFTHSEDCGSDGLQLTVIGNDILVPTFNGNLFDIRQLNDGSTEILWSLLVKACPEDNPCPLYSSPAIIADLIIFGGGEGNIHAATTEGQIVWSYGTLGLVASSPAISHNTIYFGSYDGSLYAVSIDGQ
ncbi:MAG: PQQ-binding-like beta-propeller repeat protein, partial [Nitrospiria bacterium]